MVKNYYKSLGPDIVAQLGKYPKGSAPVLSELLTKLIDPKGNIITSSNIEKAINNLRQAEKINPENPFHTELMKYCGKGKNTGGSAGVCSIEEATGRIKKRTY